jgi:hypothetical protein
MINVTQITRKLSMLPDGELKNFAEMHKQDPYTFSLAISESVRRKDLRSAPRPEEQQPTVADQQLSAMTELPEDVGIAALPMSMNLASGGIVAFDDGGDVYSNEGRNSKTAYREYALAKAKENGVDPVLVDSIFNIESGYKADAQSPTGPQGIGQLTKATGKAYGVNPEDRKDPYKNIDASIAFMADLNKKYAGDPSKIAVAYNQGETVLNKHLRANKGELNASALPTEAQGYLKKLQKFAFKLAPGATAQAESLPAAQTTSAVNAQPSQPKVVDGYEVDQFGIPGRKADAPRVQAPEPVDERSIFEKGATYAGIPQEFQRNFSNTLNAFGGGFGGAPRMARGIQSGAKALEEAVQATPEAVAAAAAAAQKIANTRIAKPVAQGIENLTQEAQALRKAAENTRLARALKGDTDAARAAQKSVDQSNETAKLLRQQAEAADLAKATQVNRINQGANAVRLNSGLNAVDAQMQRGNFAATDPRRTDAKQVEALNTPAAQSSTEDMPREIQSLENRYPLKKEDLTKKDQKEIIDDAKDAVPPSAKTKGFTNDDWLQFGLALMAGKSQYAFENIGNAGLSAVAGKKEREKEERAMLSKMMDKTDMTKVIERLRMEDPKLSYRDAYDIYSAGRTALEAKNRGIDVRQDEALTNRIKAYQDGMKEIRILGIIADSPTATPAQKKAYADAKAALGPNPALQATGTQVAPAASTMPALPGAKIVGSRPA